MSPARTIAFSSDDVDVLKGELKLTDQQVFWLKQRLGAVRDCLGPHTRMEDVRGELKSLQRDVNLASKRLARWKRAVRPSIQAEALGHLNMAQPDDEVQRPDDGTWPEYIVASELIVLLQSLVNTAASAAPSARRSPHRSSEEAIDIIVQALRRPQDEESLATAKALTPNFVELKQGSKENEANHGFLALAKVVFGAVHKSLSVDGKPASPAPSIRAYLDRQSALGLARKRGRPRKKSV
jgi:hypothetical protein